MSNVIITFLRDGNLGWNMESLHLREHFVGAALDQYWMQQTTAVRFFDLVLLLAQIIKDTIHTKRIQTIYLQFSTVYIH